MTTIGIALSGGGARGIAHLGVLQAIDELGIEISEISGTSFGAVAGAFYACGIAPYQALKLVQKTKLIFFIRPAISKTGLLKVEKLNDLFAKYLPVDSFQKLNKKLTVNATDIKRGEAMFFDSGDLIPAILASCCMPVIFDPIVIDGVAYIDGGILNNLPVEPLESRCELIIGSHCNPVHPEFRIKNAKALLERTLLMAIRNNTLQRQNACQFYIEPPELGSFIGSDFDKATEIFQIGYDHVYKNKEQLLKLVEGSYS
jgi:NTE family protein